MQAASDVTKTFWTPLTPTQILFLSDTVENRRNFERMGLQTFYVPDLTDQQLAEMTNSLRVLLNLRYIAQDKGANTITIRAEMPLLNAAGELIRSLTTGRPEVLLDLNVYAVSTSVARSLGTALPTQFNLFNITPALLGGTGTEFAEPDQPVDFLRWNQRRELNRHLGAIGPVGELHHQFDLEPALRTLWRRTDPLCFDLGRNWHYANVQPQQLRHPEP